MEYDLMEELFSIDKDNGYDTIRLTRGRWGANSEKYDLRLWNNRDNRPSKGLTLSEEELRNIYDALYEYFESKLDDETEYEDDDDSEEIEEQIDYKKFLVYTNTNLCKRNEHEIESIKALVKIQVGENEERYRIAAFYCKDCGIYYITEELYKQICAIGTIMCPVYSQSEYLKMINSNDEGLKQESLLHAVGYNVGAKANLSDEQRRKILNAIIENDLLSKRRVISYLQWMIDYNGRNQNMKNAREKWQSDINYLRGYVADTGVRSIIK